MKLNELKFISGSRRRPRIVGRGKASGSGKTCGRGHDGQNCRSGGGTPPGFEGGQMPLQRRMPKRGFNSKRVLEYQLVNIQSLTSFKEASLVTPEVLFEKGLIRDQKGLIKILGDGELNNPLTIRAHAFSQGAALKIKKAGGVAEQIKI